MSNERFHTKERGNKALKFIEYYNSKEYTVKPDVVNCEGKKRAKRAFDLVWGDKMLREIGIIQDFWTTETTIDEIILPMRDMNSLFSDSKIEKAWSVNQSMVHEP